VVHSNRYPTFVVVVGDLIEDRDRPRIEDADNAIENLVVADPRCNNDKRDFLAAGGHVERWAVRFDRTATVGRQLAEIAQSAGWDSHPERTFNAARTIYSRLPPDIRLWLHAREFAALAAERENLMRALRAA
jgi:hypothetical protein